MPAISELSKKAIFILVQKTHIYNNKSNILMEIWIITDCYFDFQYLGKLYEIDL